MVMRIGDLHMHRRHLLTTGLAMAAFPALAASSGLKLTLLGQALIEHDVSAEA